MIKVAPPTTRAHVRTVGRCGKPMTVRGPSESNSRHTKAAPIATTKNGASTEPAVPLNSQDNAAAPPNPSAIKPYARCRSAADGFWVSVPAEVKIQRAP